MLISIGLHVFNVVCAARRNMQNCPRQLAMQSCVLCSFVRCGTSKTNRKKKAKKKHINSTLSDIIFQQKTFHSKNTITG